MPAKIEVLYFDGCPNHHAVVARLRELMTELGMDATVALTRIDSVEAAKRARFLGSPTLRIDGEDVEPAARSRTDFGLRCRLYASATGLRGTIPDALVLTGLAAHRAVSRAPEG